VNDFRIPSGFEEALRPPVRMRRARLAHAVLRVGRSGDDDAGRAQLQRVVRGAPEVMVKITGRTRDGGHLQRHLDYITRNGKLILEGPDGERLIGRADVRALAEDWRSELSVVAQRRDAPVSLSIVLSMPAGTDEGRVHDASRAFASRLFADRHPYVFALHTDDRHPHVHLTVRALGRNGERLNPRKADLQLWRETFAAALRDRGVEAEATPRRARGVVRKAERTPVRKLRERFERGEIGRDPFGRRAGLGDASSSASGRHPTHARGRGVATSNIDGRGRSAPRPGS
jgi:Relaxase/Mobilisation nuclease domain